MLTTEIHRLYIDPGSILKLIIGLHWFRLCIEAHQCSISRLIMVLFWDSSWLYTYPGFILRFIMALYWSCLYIQVHHGFILTLRMLLIMALIFTVLRLCAYASRQRRHARQCVWFIWRVVSAAHHRRSLERVKRRLSQRVTGAKNPNVICEFYTHAAHAVRWLLPA